MVAASVASWVRTACASAARQSSSGSSAVTPSGTSTSCLSVARAGSGPWWPRTHDQASPAPSGSGLRRPDPLGAGDAWSCVRGHHGPLPARATDRQLVEVPDGVTADEPEEDWRAAEAQAVRTHEATDAATIYLDGLNLLLRGL